MTIGQAKRFYEQDLKKYNISKNKEFLNWIKDLTSKGYHSFVDINELQELIDFIAYWYEIKYPDNEIEIYKEKDYRFGNLNNLSQFMNLEQLMYRLSIEQQSLMNCSYRTGGGGIRQFYNDNGNVYYKDIIYLKIGWKNTNFNCTNSSYFILIADPDNGLVNIDYRLKFFVKVNNENITLDELLNLLKENYSKDYDLKELQECIYDHECDIELRKKVLELIALKLLYSNRTLPENGYVRAKNFIEEFNNEMNINLSSLEIDEIFNRDYTNEKLKKSDKCFVKSILRK